MPRLLLGLALLGTLTCARVEAGETGTAAVEVPASVAIPFAHRVGERWRILVDRREDVGGRTGTTVATEAEAEVVSLYGRDFLVDLRWLSVTEAARTTVLASRSAANAPLLDARGGGRLSLRVDRQGTAVDLLNADEVRTALARARGRAIAESAWPAERTALLATWNTVYRACGVPIAPGTDVVTPLRDAEAREIGRDVRRLRVEARATGRAPALALSTDTSFGDPAGAGDLWREVIQARYDLDAGRLSGTSVVDQRAAGRTSRVHLSFREAPVPLPPAAGVVAAVLPAR
jgi:hypothetical protein